MKKTSKANNERIWKLLEESYPDAKPALVFRNPFELLVATILSAQCTDARVNRVTEVLFERWPDPQSLAAADREDIADVIKSCGCYQVKAKNLNLTAKAICETFGGRVPEELEELTTLPGVGRKTANVVLSNAFGKPGFAVDTHVFRVSNRTGLADARTPEEAEKQLCAQLPPEVWGTAHHWLIWHGRRVCSARKPKCDECPLTEVCAKRM